VSFQMPVSIKDILAGIHHKEYLLPAIQREFVWDGDQVRPLVDSLMRGYPISSFTEVERGRHLTELRLKLNEVEIYRVERAKDSTTQHSPSTCGTFVQMNTTVAY